MLRGGDRHSFGLDAFLRWSHPAGLGGSIILTRALLPLPGLAVSRHRCPAEVPRLGCVGPRLLEKIEEPLDWRLLPQLKATEALSPGRLRWWQRGREGGGLWLAHLLEQCACHALAPEAG